MKKVLLRLCTVLVVIGLMVGMIVPVFADSIDNGEWGDLTWKLNQTTGELIISGNGSMKSLNYSEQNSAWRAYISSIQSVTIEEGVTCIGECAFAMCENLTSVEIPSTVTSIGENAFYNCDGIKNITIPLGVTQIDRLAFEDCSNLTNVEIPASVMSIGSMAFMDCGNLESIELPLGLTEISYMMFYGCHNLKNVVLPTTVTSIEDFAFFDCRNLASINLPVHLSSINDNVFYWCHSLESIKIPDGVTSIGTAAFFGCSGLESVNIPSSVTNIGSNAFRCKGLTSITVDESNPNYHSNGNCLIETKSKILILGCKNSVIPADESVTIIGDRAFSGCSSLDKIDIPLNVKRIGESAFYGCNLKTVCYMGTQDDWKNVEVGAHNESLLSALQFDVSPKNNSENNPSDTEVTIDSYIENVADKRERAIIGIVIGCTAVAGVGGASIWWFAIKKKKFSDLAKLVKKTPKVPPME